MTSFKSLLGDMIAFALLGLCLSAAGPLVSGQQNGEQASEADPPLGFAGATLGGSNLKKGNFSNKNNNNNHDNDHNFEPIKVQYVNVNGLPVLVQFTYVGPPKILPISTADSYPEGSSINLICTVSGGQRRGLVLTWTVNEEDLGESSSKWKYLESFSNVAINTDDTDISILKIKNATSRNSGQYTCTARNPLGQDSTSVKIAINGKCLSGSPTVGSIGSDY